MAQITNRQALLGFFDFELPTDLVEKVITDNGIQDEAVYTASNAELIETGVIDICGSLILLDSYGEGGLSMKYNKKAIDQLRNSLIDKWDLGETKGSTQGSISSRKVW